MIYITLFLEFFKTGLFSVGGGLATIPFLREMTEKYTWLTLSQLSDIIAIAESTPGPIGINCATYVGYNAAGVLGGIVATLSLVLPSIIAVFIVAKALERYNKSKLVQGVFTGLRPAAIGLIAAASWSVINDAIFNFSTGASIAGILKSIDVRALILFAVLLVLTNMNKLKNWHPVIFLGFAAVIGVIFKF